MLRPKDHLFPFRPFVTRSFPVRLFLALIVAAALCGPLRAQSANTITVLMLDGKTGKPIVPSNFIVRFDHRNAVHNESVSLDDEGVARILVPAGATFLAVQGTFNSSMEIYVNCDAGMEKDISTLHWYSVDEILRSGVAMPNECYKGKYAEATRSIPKPGMFVFFVRKNNWHEMPPD
jgi:hypothetical protein